MLIKATSSYSELYVCLPFKTRKDIYAIKIGWLKKKMYVRHILEFLLLRTNDYGALKKLQNWAKQSFFSARILRRKEELSFPGFHSRAPLLISPLQSWAAPSGLNQLTQIGCNIDLTASEEESGDGEGRAGRAKTLGTWNSVLWRISPRLPHVKECDISGGFWSLGYEVVVTRTLFCVHAHVCGDGWS